MTINKEIFMALELLAGTNGLVWNRLAREKGITVRRAKEVYYVQDIYEESK